MVKVTYTVQLTPFEHLQAQQGLVFRETIQLFRGEPWREDPLDVYLSRGEILLLPSFPTWPPGSGPEVHRGVVKTVSRKQLQEVRQFPISLPQDAVFARITITPCGPLVQRDTERTRMLELAG
jgi:hypothetical protein